MEINKFEDDLLGVEEFADRLESFIEVERRFVSGSLVMALSSKFGSGKTTFLKMWENRLESCQEDNVNKEKIITITLNAWESDYYGDPLFAILSSLIEALPKNDESKNSILDAAKDIGWFTIALGGQVTEKFTGLAPMAAGKEAEDRKEKRENLNIFNAFSIFEERKRAMNHLKDVLEDFISGSNYHILFLVDELDRCRPDYAISYLETIKHIFDIEGATFILAADRDQLENSAKTAFGNDLNFDEYYRKFIHREVTLPPVSDVGYEKLTSEYVKWYLEMEDLRVCYMGLDRTPIDRTIELITVLRLTLRQIQEVFRILGHVFATTNEKRGRLRWAIAIGTIAMATFKVADQRAYEGFGRTQLTAEEAFNFFSSLFNEENSKRWFNIFLTGGGIEIPKDVTDVDILKQVGIAEKNSIKRDWEQTLIKYEEGWGPSHRKINRISEIKEKIDQIMQWA